MKDTVNLAIENCDNANGRMKIGIFNSTPISINPVEWPVHYEMVLPVVSIKPNGNDSSLLDMIAENTCKLDMPPAHELGSPVWWKDDLNQLQHYFTKRTSLNLKVRKSKSHGTLMCCETNKENIGTLIQDKIIKFDEIETIVRNMILCHNGSYIDEYSPIITILEAAINHDDLAKSSVIGVTPSGMAQIYNSDDDWELLIEESEIFEGFKEWRYRICRVKKTAFLYNSRHERYFSIPADTRSDIPLACYRRAS